MADLSRWLHAAEMLVEEIDCDIVARFLAKRRHTHTQFITERALAPLLRYLEMAGVVSVVAPNRRPHGELLREYERYLVEERAVLPARRDLCLAVAAEFIDGKRAGSIKAKDVTQFVDARAGRPGLSGVLSALRSVLRFLFVTSKTALNLIYAVPAAPRWEAGLTSQVPRDERVRCGPCNVRSADRGWLPRLRRARSAGSIRPSSLRSGCASTR
jgi:hypothetical protein